MQLSMKCATVMAVLSAIVGVQSLPSASDTTNTVETRAPLTCGNPARAVLLYRTYHPRVLDHFYTTSYTEARKAYTNLGYTDEGAAGYIFPSAEPHTVPLYRLYHPGIYDHFYTADAAEKDNARDRLGYTYEGVAGYVYPDAVCGGLPLYRAWNGGWRDHFYTMSEAEVINAQQNLGFVREGVAGYMFPM